MPRKKAEERKTKERGNGQGTVWQEGTVYRWQVTLGYTADGRRITRSGRATSKKAAHEAMTQVQADYSRGLISAADSITMAEYTERWLKRQHEVKARTAENYKVELAYALKHIGKLRVRDVKPHHLKDLLATLGQQEMQSGNTMSARTLAHVRTRLRSLLREAVSDQIIYVNPMDGVKRGKGTPRQETAGQVFDEAQLRRFYAVGWALEAAGLCRLFPALFTAVSVGLRRGEVMGLTWKDVDLERGVLHIRQTRVEGVNGVEVDVPKTVNSRRDIPMPESLVRVLREYRVRQDAERAVAGKAWDGSNLVFADALGGPVHPNNLNRSMDRVLEWSDPETFEQKVRHLVRSVPREAVARLRAEVIAGKRLPDRSPHDLRHTYATLALRRGVPVEVVSKILGHANVSITLNVYRHVLDNEKRAHVVDLFMDMPPARAVPAGALN